MDGQIECIAIIFVCNKGFKTSGRSSLICTNDSRLFFRQAAEETKNSQQLDFSHAWLKLIAALLM